MSKCKRKFTQASKVFLTSVFSSTLIMMIYAVFVVLDVNVISNFL